ncbi:MAG: response regulator [Acidobacteria bacterium]|nr:response regulator [Acidobacteriota bacterium]
MTKNVLIVDDTRFIRTMLRDLLQSSGRYRIAAEATNGREAVDQYKSVAPDLVLMDIVMPEMDGIQATVEILREDPSATIVMCSAMGQEALVVEAIHAGAKDFILKPFTEERILTVLRKVLIPQAASPKGSSN